MKKNLTSPDEEKKKIVMYYAYPDKVGGPLTYINTIVNSELKNKYHFDMLFQNKAPGGMDLKLLFQMTKEIKQMKPEVLHVHGVQSEGFYGVLAGKLAGCKKIVMTVHGFACDDSNCKGIKRFLYSRIVEPTAIRWADKVYCVCESAAKRKIVKSNTRGINYGAIHNPVPVMTSNYERDEIRNNLGFVPNDIVFAYSGRVTIEKGFDVIDQICDRIYGEDKNRIKFLIIGDGIYLDDFRLRHKKQIESNEIITIGRTDCVADYLFAADAFIFPSHHENLPIALLEAEYVGLPCIVSNVGGNPEIVKDQITGYVINNQDIEEYIQAMYYLSNNEQVRKDMGRKAHDDVIERFSLTNICRELERVYDEW